VNQFRKAASADPKAFHIVPDGEEVVGVFAGPAGEAADGDVFLFGLGFCFFPIKFDGMSFFYRKCTFGTDADAETHAIAELFGYYLCFSVDNFNSTFGTGCDSFSAACTFFFINYYHSFYH
jgi:hypothetical protein